MRLQASPTLPSELLHVDFELLQMRERRSLRHHWYHTANGPAVSGVLIACLSDRGDTVLDPFCGTGTVLIEACRQGRRPVGGDVNPVAGLITRARLTRPDPATWQSYTAKLSSRIVEIELSTLASGHADAPVPAYAENSAWYHESTLAELAAVWQAIKSIRDPYQHVAEVAFSSILRSVSSSRGPVNRIADNVRPATIHYRPVVDRFLSALAAVSRGSDVAAAAPPVDGGQDNIWVGHSGHHLGALRAASVDLVVTYLPEFGVADYVRSQRLSALWFGWDLATFEQDEIGARFKRRREDSVAGYLDTLADLFGGLARVVRDHGWCAIILGQSTDRAGITDSIVKVLKTRGFTISAAIVGARPGRADRLGQQTVLLARRES